MGGAAAGWSKNKKRRSRSGLRGPHTITTEHAHTGEPSEHQPVRKTPLFSHTSVGQRSPGPPCREARKRTGAARKDGPDPGEQLRMRMGADGNRGAATAAVWTARMRRWKMALTSCRTWADLDFSDAPLGCRLVSIR